MLKAVKTQAETYIGDNIEYDVKSFQVKATIVKRTKIWEKGLTVNRSQKNCWHGQWVCDTMNQILQETETCAFQYNYLSQTGHSRRQQG